MSPRSRALGKRPRIGIRVAASSGWNGQFGLSIDQGEAFAAIKQVHEIGAVELSAIHCHAGGMLRSAHQVLGYVDEVLALADRVKGTWASNWPYSISGAAWRLRRWPEYPNLTESSLSIPVAYSGAST